MTDLYLIAHKVRGEPAFDIAVRMPCPECCSHLGETVGCTECDHTGYWWIIPTSGHRAYPWWNTNLLEWDFWEDSSACNAAAAMPPNLPDHYITSAAPRPKLDIRALFRKAIPQTFIRRRI